ncbi:hypothetical protein [Amycolatopsis sp. NPDC049159]|uniref:hypothetical protein n=1 Tax=Amycolatopsis sp. NPDC049159 TaxID=3157210 RepID=UPI0033E5F3A0
MMQPEDARSGSENLIAGDVSGTVFQAQQVSGDVYLGERNNTKSRYLETVREIAPRVLAGRDSELAELVRFCEAPDSSTQYVWWRAEAWTGKTALVSWFVLNPPENVRLVSFFITARFAGYDTRADFLTVVLPQLSEMLGIEVPDGDGPSNFRGLLAEAAELCVSRGERLALVVDGLDEDRAAGEAGGAKSIAALLPRSPARGLRIIVTGRPNPALPEVLAADHPLRDPEVVRELVPSAAASAARETMESDLDRLLGVEVAEARAVLGFLVSARGGLSKQDLVELVGLAQERQVRMTLNSVEGRVFSRRPARWNPVESPEVYLLSHENLQTAAADRLGTAEMRGYAERIIEWAEGYRARGWPVSTPQFLLHSYPRILQENGRLSLMVECVTDLARQNRLQRVTEGEAAAQAEVAAAHALATASADPDIVDVLTLTMHRTALRERNARTPDRLPALWARLGEIGHGEALAHSFSVPHRRVEAVAELVDVLVEAGHAGRAERLVEETADEAKYPGPWSRLARAIAAKGDTAKAISILERIVDLDWRRRTLVMMAADQRQVEIEPLLVVASEIKNVDLQGITLSDLMGLQLERAFGKVVNIPKGISPLDRIDPIGRLVRGLAATGDFAAARQVIESESGEGQVESLGLRLRFYASLEEDPVQTRTQLADMEDDSLRDEVSLSLIDLALVKGLVEFAGSLVLDLSVMYRAMGLYAVLRAYGSAGLYDDGMALLEEVLSSLNKRPGLSSRPDAMTALAEGLVLSGDIERARVLAGEAEFLARQEGGALIYSQPFRKFVDLVVYGRDVAVAERMARICLTVDVAQDDVVKLSRLLAESGDVNLAEELAFRLVDLPASVKELVVLLRRLRQSGENDSILRLVARVEDCLKSIGSGRVRGDQHVCFVEFFCVAGFVGRALEISQSFESLHDRRRSYLLIVKELCVTGEVDAAVECVRDRIADGDRTHELSVVLAEGLAKAGCEDGMQILAGLGLAAGSAAKVFIERLAERDGPRALELAKSELKSFDRISVMLSIAGRLAEPLRSEVLVDLASGDEWSQVLSVLPSTDHPGLARMADQYIRLQEARLGLRSPDDRPA